MAQMIEHLPYKHKDMSLIFLNPILALEDRDLQIPEALANQLNLRGELQFNGRLCLQTEGDTAREKSRREKRQS